MTEPKTQLDKFKEAARDLGTDDDEARFDERVKKLVKHKPAVISADPGDPEDFDVTKVALDKGLAERLERKAMSKPTKEPK